MFARQPFCKTLEVHKTHMSQYHIAKNSIGVERWQKENSDGTTYLQLKLSIQGVIRMYILSKFIRSTTIASCMQQSWMFFGVVHTAKMYCTPHLCI